MREYTGERKKFGSAVLQYHFNLRPNIELDRGVEWIYPYTDRATRHSMSAFFSQYYDDTNERIFLFGINPGRFGAGITGIPFTDPVRLEVKCGIGNPFQKRAELSSVFIYDCIEAMGGPQTFYSQFYITSLCPLGFLKDGKNYNYYDDRETEKRVTPFIEENISAQISFGCNRAFAFSIGQGKNFACFKKLNAQHRWFDEIIPLPHPRWVMQYRLKQKDRFLSEYREKLSLALDRVQ